MFKKFSLILVALVALTLTAQGRIVLDTEGNKIEIADEITYAMPNASPMLQIAVMLGNEDKVIYGGTRLDPLMKKIFPKVRTSGNKSGMLGDSVETIISLKPQVVFGPTNYLLREEGVRQVRAAGIPVVNTVKFLSIASVEEIKQSVTLIGAIFGGESIKRAKEFNEYLDGNIAFVQARTNKLAKNQRKRVLDLGFRSGNFSANSPASMSAAYIESSGAINVTSEAGKDFKVSGYINEEQVIIFDPDIIITGSREGLNKIMSNPAFKSLKAVKNKQVFIIPSGLHIWSARSAETALCPLWLAKVVYPELFADLNLEQKTREFYKRFYNYDLNDKELDDILNPKEKGRW